MSNPWFRFYSAAIRHPKVAKLPDNDFRLWLNLLAVACENNGFIPPLEDLKHVLNARLDHLLRGVERLISALLIDRLEVGYTPHNWTKKQFISDTSAPRVTLHRKKNAVTVTPPEQNRTEQNRTEQIKEKNLSVSDETRPISKEIKNQGFEEFWKLYPKDAGMSKAEALKAWGGLNDTDRISASSAIPNFKVWASKQGKDYRMVHACRYISQKRFDGFVDSVRDQASQVSQVFVLENSVAFKAWEKAKGKKLPVVESRENGNQRGWHFPTEFP
jgi:hypothetical protein